MTARKPTNRTKAASKAAKTIELTAEDVTKHDTPEVAQGVDAEAVSEPATQKDANTEPESPASEPPAPEADAAPEVETSEAGSSVGSESVASKDEEASSLEETKPDVEEDAEEPVVAPVIQPAPVVEKKGSFGSGLIGGLLGGVAVVALSYVGLQQGMISLPSPDAQQSEQASQLSSLSSEVSELKTQISEIPQVDIAPIETRIADAEAQIASVGEKIAALATMPSNDAPTDNVASANGETSTVADPVDVNSPVSLQLEALTARLEGLKQQLDGLGDLSGQLETAKSKLSELETQATQQAKLIEQKATEQTALLEQELKTAKDSIMSSADRRINDVVTDLSNLGSKISAEASAIVGRVTTLEENNLSEKMQSSARTIALAGLENAVASGANYQLALTTFSEVVGNHDALDILTQYAETGAPTKAKLTRDYRSVYDTVLSEAESAGAATLMDKLLLNAQNLVRVRSLSGEKKGESLTNKLGVIEFHVGKGDLATAAAEWDALPEAARDAKAGADWLSGLKARIAVDAAMDTIRAEFGNGANGNAQ